MSQGIVVMYYRIVCIMRRDRTLRKNRAEQLRFSVFRNISLLLFFFTLSWCPNYIVELHSLFIPGEF